MPAQPDPVTGSRLRLPLLYALWKENSDRLTGVVRAGKAIQGTHGYEVRRLLAMLGIGLEQGLNYLFRERPTYEAFENWILTLNPAAADEKLLQLIRLETEDDSGGAGIPDVLTSDDLTFWETNGYVILRQAVPETACQAAELAVWEFTGRDPQDPETWYAPVAVQKGVWVSQYQHPALEVNRKSLRIRKAFEQLWGTTALWESYNRIGFNPPERPGYDFQGTPLHWDISLKQPIACDMAGMLYLTDVSPEQGAFSCVPGFHHRIVSWLNGLPSGADPREAALAQLLPEAVPVAGKAGDCIIWRQELPHAATPNRALRPRIVQYIAWHPHQLHFQQEWI